MRLRVYFTVSVALLLCAHFSVWAKPVQPERAQRVAANFYTSQLADHHTRSATPSLRLLYTKRNISTAKRARTQEEALYYIFAIDQQKGFIILSADDATYPILGYSLTNAYLPGEEPPHLAKWLRQYEEQIAEAKRRKLTANPTIGAQWETLSSGVQLRTQSAVSPLLATHWNQSPYYNAQCPLDNESNERTVTGCVATAMAQLMNFHNHPTQGVGFHSYNHEEYGTLSANFGSTTYDWNSMPNTVTAPNDAVALLNYHCGVSVDMNYNVAAEGGSSAYGSFLVAPTLQRYFSYASTTTAVARIDYEDQAWKNLLKAELDAGRPMFYEGSGAGSGHAFVCDGYDNNDFFHFNWGWGGAYDGYFHIDALNPSGLGTGGGTGNYNSNHAAVIGIAPAERLPINLQLYTATTVNNADIGYQQPFEVSVDVANYGTDAFVGDLTVALFDSDDIFVTYVENKEDVAIAVGDHTGVMTFRSEGIAKAYPGNYSMVVYHRVAQGEWITVAAGSFENPSAVRISAPDNDIKMYDTLRITPVPIVQNEPFDVFFNVANFNQTEAYTGSFRVDLYDLDGNPVLNIEEQSGFQIPAFSYYTDGLTFNSSGIDAEPGTYLLVIVNRPDGGAWQMISADEYPNPTRVTVVAPPPIADQYEDNNAETTAHTLPLNFIEHQAAVRTQQANLHTGTDYDYYQVTLPPGYAYELEALVHDAQSVGFTADVLLSYEKEDVWSEAFDTRVTETIALDSGGTLSFWISPFFVGTTGTYELEINVTRSEYPAEEVEEEIEEPAAAEDEVAQEEVNVQTIVLLAPESLDTLRAFSTQIIRWSSFSLASGVRIDLYKDSVFVRNLAFSTSGDGSFTWRIPDDIVVGDGYQIRISSAQDKAVYVMSVPFALTGGIADRVTGVEDRVAPIINVYPNPASDHIILELPPRAEAAAYYLTVYNSQGQLMRTFSQWSGQRTVLRTTQYPAGVYRLQWSSSQGKTHHRSFIVQ